MVRPQNYLNWIDSKDYSLIEWPIIEYVSSK